MAVKSSTAGIGAGVSRAVLTAFTASAKDVRGGSDVGSCVWVTKALRAGTWGLAARIGRESVLGLVVVDEAIGTVGATGGIAGSVRVGVGGTGGGGDGCSSGNEEGGGRRCGAPRSR